MKITHIPIITSCKMSLILLMSGSYLLVYFSESFFFFKKRVFLGLLIISGSQPHIPF